MISEATILAWMLAVATPGETTNSVTELVECDARCQATPACPEWPSRLVCKPPFWSARRRAWVRYESYSEGLARYRMIAGALAKVVNDPPEEWVWDHRQLAVGLVVIARHESAFWRAVQTGDIRGKAGEVCLVQINSGTGYSQAEREAMVGDGPDAVQRCFEAGALLLAKARAACGADGAGWFRPTVGAYGSGARCGGRWTLGRAWMYHQLWKRPDIVVPARLLPTERDCLRRRR